MADDAQMSTQGFGPAADKLAYTIDQAAEAVGLGRSSLYEAIKDGDLWTFKARGRTLILREVLVDYIADQAAPYRPKKATNG